MFEKSTKWLNNATNSFPVSGMLTLYMTLFILSPLCLGLDDSTSVSARNFLYYSTLVSCITFPINMYLITKGYSNSSVRTTALLGESLAKYALLGFYGLQNVLVSIPTSFTNLYIIIISCFTLIMSLISGLCVTQNVGLQISDENNNKIEDDSGCMKGFMIYMNNVDKSCPGWTCGYLMSSVFMLVTGGVLYHDTDTLSTSRIFLLITLLFRCYSFVGFHVLNKLKEPLSTAIVTFGFSDIVFSALTLAYYKGEDILGADIIGAVNWINLVMLGLFFIPMIPRLYAICINRKGYKEWADDWTKRHIRSHLHVDNDTDNETVMTERVEHVSFEDHITEERVNVE